MRTLSLALLPALLLALLPPISLVGLAVLWPINKLYLLGNRWRYRRLISNTDVRLRATVELLSESMKERHQQLHKRLSSWKKEIAPGLEKIEEIRRAITDEVETLGHSAESMAHFEREALKRDQSIRAQLEEIEERMNQLSHGTMLVDELRELEGELKILVARGQLPDPDIAHIEGDYCSLERKIGHILATFNAYYNTMLLPVDDSIAEIGHDNKDDLPRLTALPGNKHQSG